MDTSNSVNTNSVARVREVSPREFASYGQGLSKPEAQPKIYTTGNDGQQSVFNNRDDANAFTWQEYKKTHPDAPEQGHVDNGWDAFKRGFSDTVKNPVGQTVSQIAKAAGSSPQTQQELYKAGGNPLGYTARELGAAAGASPATQDKLEKAGGVAESAAPVWGQARFYGQVAGDAANGKPPSLDDTRGITQDVKSIGSRQPSASAITERPAQTNIAQESAGKPSFNPPKRLDDGRIGYPMSPTQAAKLPGASNDPTLTGASTSTSANRDALGQRVGQSPHSENAGSYPNTVGIVNDALKQGGVGLSDSSLANIKKNMDSVDNGSLTHAQASFRESGSFAKDAMNRQLSIKDRLTAAAGAVINGTAGPAFMAEQDMSNHLKSGSNGNTEQKAVMNGMMTNDPLYNH